jgi:ketosteroid isomerase-like protein
MPRHSLISLTLSISLLSGLYTHAQQAPTGAPTPTPPALPGTVPGTVPASGYHLISPVVQPTIPPGVVELIELEGKFADDVAKGGGKAFGTWFAPDAVALSNGKPAVLGRGAIAAQANWDPKEYSLTWTAQGAQMGPSNDMGFTWGRYVGKSTDANGKPIVTSGRYITIWRKLPDGTWKVAMDASADDAADPGTCCALPKP